MERTVVYSNKGKTLTAVLKDLRGYKYLVKLLIKRDLVAAFKQSLLGGIWFVLQPVLTALVYTIVFGVFVRAPTDGYPAFLYFFSGLVVWNGFALTFSKVSNTLLENAAVFSKVYFPRMVAPVASALSTSVGVLVQFMVLLAASVYFKLKGEPIVYSFRMLPALVLLAAAVLFGFGAGLLVASISVKYRDLIHALPFLTALLMYASPILYSFSALPDIFRGITSLNPLAGIIMGFKYFLFGIGSVGLFQLVYGCVFSFCAFAAGVYFFNRAQASFVDLA